MAGNGAVYIIHSSKDNDICSRYADALRERGIDVWFELDQPQLPPHKIGQENVLYMERSSVILYMMTKESLSSLYVKLELDVALAIFNGRRNVVFVPVQLEPIDFNLIPPAIRSFRRIEAYQIGFDESVRTLLSTLSAGHGVRRAYAPPGMGRPELGKESTESESRRLEAAREEARKKLEEESSRRIHTSFESLLQSGTILDEYSKQLAEARKQLADSEMELADLDMGIVELAPSSGSTRPVEQVLCTAYHPREIQRKTWESLLVYISPDDEKSLAFISSDAVKELGDRQEQFRPVAIEGKSPLKRGAKLTVTPAMEGFSFKPQVVSVIWQEEIIRCDFQLCADKAIPGEAVNGSIKILAGPFLFAEIPMSIYVLPAQGRTSAGPKGIARMMVRNFRKIFASYSHKDTDVVMLCREAAEALDDQYLMDITLLHSGDNWDEKLLKSIEEADVFQLFWSRYAACSPNVEKEWRRALALQTERPRFIQPLYWSAKPYRIPRELAKIHFAHLDLARIGLRKSKPFWQRFRRAG